MKKKISVTMALLFVLSLTLPLAVQAQEPDKAGGLTPPVSDNAQIMKNTHKNGRSVKKGKNTKNRSMKKGMKNRTANENIPPQGM